MAKEILPNEAANLLIQAGGQIKSLREQNKTMKARLDMFDDCMALLTAKIERNGQGMSPDLVWEIEKYVKDHLEVEE